MTKKKVLQKTLTYLRSDATQDASLLIAVLPRLIDLLKSPEVEKVVRTLVQAIEKVLELMQTDEITIMTKASLALLKSQELVDLLGKFSAALLQVP